MEYIIEQFNLDMRKLDLYVENAENEYLFACEEASLYGDDEDLLMEAGESFGSKLKNFFTTLIEKIRTTIAKIIEKLKDLFTKKKAEEVVKTIQSNPELAKEKVKIPDVKKIEDACGKRRLLLKSLVKKAQAGKLTEDELEKAIEKYDKLTKIAKTAGIITVAAGSVVGLILLKNHVYKNKNKSEDGITDIEILSKGKLSEKKLKRQLDIAHGKNSAGNDDRKDAIQYVIDRNYRNGMGMGRDSDLEPDLKSHRKLAKMIALDITDTAQLDAMIANCTLDELVKLSNTSEARSDVMRKRMRNSAENSRRKDVAFADIDINYDVKDRIYDSIRERINNKQQK